MKAVVYTEYGSPDVLKLKEVEKPVPKDDEVLIKVHAGSLNSSDWEFLNGTPQYIRMWGLLKPKYNILGSDISGTVEAVGINVRQFKVGDEVLGDNFMRWGGFAEYVCAPENALVVKPDSMTFEEAATLPQSGNIAVQGLSDKVTIQPGQKVLINGAGGGAGSFAVQVAKLYGAQVTGVDSTEKLEMMRSIGADQVIDYTKEDFTQNGQQYDLVLDMVASHSILDYRRALAADGIYLMVGGSLGRILKTLILGPLISMTGSRKMGILGVKTNKDLSSVVELVEAGKIVPIIDRVYKLSEVPEALRYFGEGHAKGKVVITV